MNCHGYDFTDMGIEVGTAPIAVIVARVLLIIVAIGCIGSSFDAGYCVFELVYTGRQAVEGHGLALEEIVHAERVVPDLLRECHYFERICP